MPIKTKTTESFIEKAQLAHGARYDYSLVECKNNYTKVKIICREHGEFEQSPTNHLSNKAGCPHCGRESRVKELITQAASEFVSRSREIHGDKYTYELVNYVHSKTKVTVTCPIHGSFDITPNHHLRGHGCAKCSYEESGYTRTKFKDKCIKNNNGLGILYILGCWDDNKTEVFIKIGITSRSIKERYQSTREMPYNYKIIHEITGDPSYIYDL